MTNFDSDTDSYEDAVNKSIAFSRQGVGYFARRKAAHLLDVCRRHLGNPEVVSIVDVGCGVGLTDEYLVPHVSALHGVDLSVKALEQASARNPAAHYQPCLADALPFESATFDLAFCSCVLHHVDDDRRHEFVSELRRVVRPGGLVLIFEHNPMNPLTRLAVNRCDLDDGVVLLERRAACELLERTGLRPVERRYIMFFPRGGARINAAERALRSVPLGAQYYVAALRG
ncbi:MAG: class I SAM-dependent methyltransferase [Actinomycetota bacterium]|nr:class I SAM-dependent methyltransferase [Actinomycetota bacterium]